MIFRNRVAYALWGFAAVFLVFVAAMTWVGIAGDPGEPDSSVLVTGVLILFWFGAIGLASFAASRPVTKIQLAVGGGLRVVQRYPFRTETRHVPMEAIKEVAIVESVDDEGDPYFHARIRLSSDRDIDLAEGHDRQRVEGIRDRFLSAIR